MIEWKTIKALFLEVGKLGYIAMVAQKRAELKRAEAEQLLLEYKIQENFSNVANEVNDDGKEIKK